MALMQFDTIPVMHEPRASAPILPRKCDYSTLSSFLRCPRYGYFKHIKGWEPDRHEHHLFFGRCFHSGLEMAYKLLQSDPSASKETLQYASRIGFLKAWSPFDNVDDSGFFPKTKAVGQELLTAYWETYHRVEQDLEIIAVEATARFQLPCQTEYITKMDLIGRDSRGLLCEEHKTAGWLSQVTLDGFNLSYQGEGYLTYLHSLAQPGEHVRAIYNIIHMTKTKRDFLRHEVMRSENITNRFLSEINDHVSAICMEYAAYQDWLTSGYNRDKNFIFPFFPRLPGLSCTAFMRTCEYADICYGFPNPEIWTAPPPSFRLGFWDPELMHEVEQKED